MNLKPSNIISRLFDLSENKPFGILPGLAAYLATIIVVMVLVYIVGPTINNAGANDTIEILDVANRMWEGNRIYVDFHSGYGPLSYMFVMLGINFVGMSIKAYWIGQMIAVFLIGSLCFYVCSKRLSLFWTILATLNVAAILSEPSPLGCKVWREYGYAMWYNKFGWVFWGILLISILIPLRMPSRFSRISRSIIDGLCLACLLMVKLTFFVPTLGLYLIAKLVWPQKDDDRRSEVLWAISSMCLFTFLILLSCHTRIDLYITSSYTWSLQFDVPLPLLLFRYLQFTNMIYFIIVVLTLIFYAGFSDSKAFWPILRNLLISLVAFGCLLVCTATSCQEYDVMPFLGIIPLGACLCVRKHVSIREDGRLALSIAVLAIFLLLTIFPKDCALSMIFMHKRPPTFVALSEHSKAKGEEVVQNNYSDKCLSGSLKYIDDQGYTKKIISGLSLLNQSGSANGDVLYVCGKFDPVTLFSNCSYAKGAKGVYGCQPDVTPSTIALEKQMFCDNFLANVTWILKDESPVALSLWQRLERVKGKELETNFIEAGKNKYWTLYKRK
jgi:hypothetical protein